MLIGDDVEAVLALHDVAHLRVSTTSRPTRSSQRPQLAKGRFLAVELTPGGSSGLQSKPEALRFGGKFISDDSTSAVYPRGVSEQPEEHFRGCRHLLIAMYL